jgi:MtrB/PioB family decaheme-associated outer membrane protein
MSRDMGNVTRATIGCWFVFVASALAQPATQAASAPQAPAQSQPQAQTAPAEVDTTGSLFAPRWNQFQLGGRWTSISGDPARFQRYEDLRNGILLNGARVLRETDLWAVTAGADNVGWRDQRYFATYERTGRLTVSGQWDQIPQFYSIDTRTPYTDQGGALVLDDATQRAIQNGQGNLTRYIPLASQFDLRERRDIGQVDVRVTPASHWDVTTAFTTTKHSGSLPWGASFGFGNDVEVALPYDSRTNDLTVGAEWTNSRAMMRVAYDGSWFNNLDDTLTWDSPLRADDAAAGPSRGRMALWPSNTANTVSTAGYYKLAKRTQVTGFLSFGMRRNDETLLPFTINTAIAQPALPRATADAEARVFTTNLSLVSRPADDWRFSARLRRFDYDLRTPHFAVTQFVNYDTSLATSATGGPEPFSHNRTTFDADTTWTGLLPLALTVGFTRHNSGHDFRIFESTAENALHLTADAVGTSWATFRAHYELADRTGDGLDEELLTEIGEQPQLRHFDIANRQRHRFTGQVDLSPNDWLTASLSAGLGKDDYDDSYFGLQESTFRLFTAGFDIIHPSGLGFGGSYDYEHYDGLQQSRSATPGAQAADPLRDWTTDSTERVHYFSIYMTPPRIGRNTEARVSYDYAHARSNFVYGIVPGGPLPVPAQLPAVFNKLQDLRLEVRHRLTNRLAASVSYRYEPFDVYDFAFSSDVIDSIVQPSSLILGYLYRPYTAHSAVFGLMYSW